MTSYMNLINSTQLLENFQPKFIYLKCHLTRKLCFYPKRALFLAPTMPTPGHMYIIRGAQANCATDNRWPLKLVQRRDQTRPTLKRAHLRSQFYSPARFLSHGGAALLSSLHPTEKWPSLLLGCGKIILIMKKRKRKWRRLISMHI